MIFHENFDVIVVGGGHAGTGPFSVGDRRAGGHADAFRVPRAAFQLRGPPAPALPGASVLAVAEEPQVH